MKNKILVEGKYGHGGELKSKWKYKLNRLLRPSIGGSTSPFNWSIGVSGKPVYTIKNQYESSSCWGQAFSMLMQNIRDEQNLSAKSAYSPIFIPNGGVSISMGIKEANLLGLTTESNVPSTQNNDATEAFMEDKSWMTPKMLDDCMTRKGYQVVNIDINIDAVAQAIRDYGGVIMLIQGQNNGTWLSANPKPPVDNLNLWGHYMCSCANIRVNSNQIDFYQSWGETIGNKGIQSFDATYFNSGYIVDVFTFVKK